MTIYDILLCKKKDKPAPFNDDSYRSQAPNINKVPGALAGNSRLAADASLEVQKKVIDILIEIGVRYHFTKRDIAFLLCMVRAESGFNPDAAAATTSAGGLGQLTDATADYAAGRYKVGHVNKITNILSYKNLGFVLDVAPIEARFDAKQGAFAAAMSYMESRKRAMELVGATSTTPREEYEKYIYFYHHEGWGQKKSPDEILKSMCIKTIATNDIFPLLNSVEQELSKPTTASFTLSNHDNTPVANTPYVIVTGQGEQSDKKPNSAQKSPEAKISKGVTDSQGNTEKINHPGVGEVVLYLLNADILAKLKGKSYVTKKEVHTIKRGETLSSIAKENNTTSEDLAEKNHIKNANQIKEGQVIELPERYIERKPPTSLIRSILDKLECHAQGSEHLPEYARSHVILPNDNSHHKDGKIKISKSTSKTKPVAPKIQPVSNTTSVTNTPVPVPVATNPVVNGEKELSGVQWIPRFPASRVTDTLTPSFKTSTDAFITALKAGGASVHIANTYRPKERAYLMHWAHMIFRCGTNPSTVPSMNGVNINWVHPTLAESVHAADLMVTGFDIGHLAANVPPALQSLHTAHQAIDMSITWHGTIVVAKKDGTTVTVNTSPRTGMNSQLKEIGATYGVIKFVGGNSDKPHWSTTGH